MGLNHAPNYFDHHGHLWAAVRPASALCCGTVAWAHVAPNGGVTILVGNVIGHEGSDLHVMAHGTLFDVPRRVVKAAYRPDAHQYARHLVAQSGDWVAVRERAMLALMDAFGVTSGKALGVVRAARARWK